MTISDIVEMPEDRSDISISELPSKYQMPDSRYTASELRAIGYNYLKEIISKLPVSEKKLEKLGWMKKDKLTLDEGKIREVFGLVYTYPQHEKKVLDATFGNDLAQALKSKAQEIIKEQE